MSLFNTILDRLSKAWNSAFFPLNITAWLNELAFQFSVAIGTVVPFEQFGAKGDGVTDDSEAMQNALTSGLNRISGRPSAHYRCQNLEALAGVEVDMNGSRWSPVNGDANYLIRWSGAGYGAGIYNGYMEDPNYYTLKTSLITSTALVGATVIEVEDPDLFVVKQIIAIVTDQDDPGGKKVLHHTYPTQIVGNQITLKDALPHQASDGNKVMTTKGLVHIDGPNFYTVDKIGFDFVPLGVYLDGRNIGSQSAGRGLVRRLSFRTFLIGAGYTGTDTRIVQYENIVGYGNSPQEWRTGFGWKIDSRDFVGPGGDIGDHTYIACKMLSVQDGYDLHGAFFVDFGNMTVADNTWRYGVRVTDGSAAYFSWLWTTVSKTALSISNGSTAVAVMLRTRNNAVYSEPYAVEVDDTSSLFTNGPSWSGDLSIRDTAGWAKTNVRGNIGQVIFENGTPGFPSIAARVEPTTGFLFVQPGEIRASILGIVSTIISAAGLRTARGTAAAVPYGINGEGGTGLFSPGVGRVGLSANGTSILDASTSVAAWQIPPALPGITKAGLLAIASPVLRSQYTVTDENYKTATRGPSAWYWPDGTIVS